MAAVVDAVPALRRAADDLLAGDGLADDDYYLSSDIGGQVDHHVLYFGLDEKATAHLQAADVLFLGNSRVMYALRPQVLRPAFAALGLDYYGLGFGFREADRFPLAIIRRFDLRPRVVVVNADGFFGGGLSTWAEVVNRDTAFAARKIRWEIEIAHNVRQPHAAGGAQLAGPHRASGSGPGPPLQHLPVQDRRHVAGLPVAHGDQDVPAAGTRAPGDRPR